MAGDASVALRWVTIKSYRQTANQIICLVTEAHGCEQFTHGRYLIVERPGASLSWVGHTNHYTIKPRWLPVYKSWKNLSLSRYWTFLKKKLIQLIHY